MTAADDYIMSRNVSDKCIVKRLSNSFRTSTYSIQMNIGKQSWGFELWGSPLFNRVRDASHVKFKCIIETRQGKYKYTLFEFETNRNTIQGEAKNDGQPNVLHWQRVNSLIKEREKFVSSNNVNRRSNKEILFDFNSQIAYEACLYQAEYDATMMFVDGLKKLNAIEDFIDKPVKETDSEKELNRKLQGRNFSISSFGDSFFTMSNTSNTITSPDSRINSSNYENYKGFLLARGNNVYVRGGEYNYEQAAVQELIKQIMIDGYWNVVYDIRQAHFVLEYYVDLEGKDRAYLRITTPKGDISHKYMGQPSNESVSSNRRIAREYYLSNLASIQKNYDKGKISGNLKKFIIE